MIPKKILIFGGTHGNEWTGVMAVKKYAEFLKEKFKHLDLHFIHANPEAYLINKRFRDEDLNRAFQFLHENRPDSYEHKRAREIKELVDSAPCFVIDLHTTTSNMGNTIIITRDHPLNFSIACGIKNKLTETKIIFSPDPDQKYLASQSETGLMIEIGPVAQGVVDAHTLKETLRLIEEILKEISSQGDSMASGLEIFEEVEDIYYPQDEKGQIEAMIHEDFQGRDFMELQGEYVPFKKFSGEAIKMNASEKLYPIFINEAAYYPSKLAFTLCRKIKRVLTPLRVNGK